MTNKFCTGVQPGPSAAPGDEFEPLERQAFDDLRGRFVLRVLGLPDDLWQQSGVAPGTCSILADAPGFEARTGVSLGRGAV